MRGDLVFEEDQLIGDLTVRESLSAALDIAAAALLSRHCMPPCPSDQNCIALPNRASVLPARTAR